MQRICTTLADNGYGVTLIGRLKPDSLPLEGQNYHQIRLKCWFHQGVFFYLEYNIRLSLFLFSRNLGPYILYTVDSDTLLAGGVVKYFKGLYQVFDAHEYFTEVPELKTKPLVRRVWKIIENIFVPKADAHVTVGSCLADIFSKKFSKKFIPILNVPTLSYKQSEGNKAEPPIILYQGMLNKGRGLEPMIKAMEQIDHAVFYIIGEGDISSELRMLANNSTASERIHFLGWKSYAEMSAITSKATLAINLLENSSISYYYSLANKFFDYMHAGVPSVNMAFPEYTAIINRYEVGVTIDRLDPSLIATTIKGLLINPQKMYQMQQACQKAKQVHHWAHESEKLLLMFSQLAKQ